MLDEDSIIFGFYFVFKMKKPVRNQCRRVANRLEVSVVCFRFYSSSAACAAARRAMGTRGGEQDT